MAAMCWARGCVAGCNVAHRAATNEVTKKIRVAGQFLQWLDDRKSRARGTSCARQTVSLDTVTALALAAALPRSSGRATRANYCSFLAHACHTCELTLWNLRSWLLMSAQDWRIALTNGGLHRASAESHLVGFIAEALAPRRCRQSHQGDDEAQHQRVDGHHRQLIITGGMCPENVPSMNVCTCVVSY